MDFRASSVHQPLHYLDNSDSFRWHIIKYTQDNIFEPIVTWNKWIIFWIHHQQLVAYYCVWWNIFCWQRNTTFFSCSSHLMSSLDRVASSDLSFIGSVERYLGIVEHCQQIRHIDNCRILRTQVATILRMVVVFNAEGGPSLWLPVVFRCEKYLALLWVTAIVLQSFCMLSWTHSASRHYEA